MAYVAPSTVTTLQTYSSAAHNIIVNDIIDHETRLVALEPFMTAWTSYTPTLSGFGLGNGTLSGAYLKVGRMVMVRIKFVFGSTSTTSSSMSFAVPAAIANQSEIAAGSVMFSDSGGLRYPGIVLNSTSAVEVLCFNASGTYATLSPVQATVPFTWSTNDEVFVRFAYEATS